MKRSILAATIVVQCLSLTTAAFAGNKNEKSDGAYLDPAYKNLKHPVVDDARPAGGMFGFFDQFVNLDQPIAPTKSDTLSTIAHQTPIRNQAARGTCSIFSSTAMFEAMLIVNGQANTNVDLSEEWLEYLVTRVSGHEGSSSDSNFNALLDNGDVSESALPYIGETWSDASSGLAQQRCGTLSNPDLNLCLLGHRNPNLMTATSAVLSKAGTPLYDPAFLAAKNEAATFKAAHQATARDFDVYNTSDIKGLLLKGIPVAIAIDFYYGAWNHRGGEALGMTRNMDDWAKGIVFYPEVGSIDRDRSPEDPDGHSVLIVGYDDNVVLTKAVQMSDGTTQTFTRKGVYYFKNSWGTDNFGPKAMIDGKNMPGYGTMSQDYGNEFGQFSQLQLK